MIRRRIFVFVALTFALQLSAVVGAQERDVHPEVGKILDRALAKSGAERAKVLDEALIRARALKDRIGEGTVFFLQGAEQQALGKRIEALKLLLLGADIGKEEKFPILEAISRNSLGTIYLSLADRRAALLQYEIVVRLHEKVKKNELLSIALNGQALSLFGLGEGLRAVPLYRQSLEIAHRLGLDLQVCAVKNNLGVCLATTGERGEAIRLLKEALPMAITLKSDDLHARTLYHLGILYENLGDYSKAISWLNQALAVAVETKNTALEALIQTAIALYYSVTGQPAKSIASNQRSIALFKKLGESSLIPILLNNTALAQSLLGKLSEAEKSMAEALKLQRQLGDRHSEAFIVMNVGALALLQNKPDVARLRFAEALPLATLTGDTGVTANTLSLLAGTYQTINPEFAIALLKVSVNKLQGLRADVRGEEESTREAFKKSVKGAYQQLADLLVMRGRLAEAQQVLDLLKEDELLSFIRRSGQNSGEASLNPLEAENDAKYKEISEKVGAIGEEYSALLAKERAGLANSIDKQRIKTLESSIEAVRLEFTKFLANAALAFAKADPKGAVIEDIKNTGSLKRTLRTLTEQTGVRTVAIYTVSAETRLHLILVTPELQDVVTIPIGEQALRKKIFAFRQILLSPSLDPRPLGKELYDLLIAPVEKKLGSASMAWLWSLDGTLRYLPLGALWNGKQYAVEVRSQSVITPAGQADLTAAPADWNALAFGTSVAMSPEMDDEKLQFSALPGVARELADIAKSIPTSQFLNAAFTRDVFFEQVRLAKHEVIHVATHFHFEAGRDDASYLLLGSGGVLRFSEISQKIDSGLFDGVEILTLSACQTAMSSDADGRDFEGLAALAQRAGVRSVLASIWPVSDASTRYLMGRFYANRGQSPKMSKAEALRQAQIALIRGELKGASDDPRGEPTNPPPVEVQGQPYPKSMPEWSHPYYWAPFVLLGNSR